MWVPEKLGGWDIDPVTACRIFEDIARIDSAAAWLVQMSNAVGALGRFFSDRAVEDMLAGGDSIMADAFQPPGNAVPVDGGYKLTGQFPFASNCQHADWFIALGLIMDGDQPRMADGQAVVHMLAFPMSDAEVVDNWDTLGMRGTGSHDVKVQNLFVPEHRAPPLVPIVEAANKAWSAAANNLTIWHVIASIGMTPLGIAHAAIDEFTEIARAKTAAYQTQTVSTQMLAHYRLGEAKVILSAARANMYETLSRVWESAKAGNFISVEQKCDMQLAGSYAARAACDAVELIAASTGANAIRQSSRFNRHLRDLRTITQHAYVSTDRYEDVGAMAVGQTQKWGFLFF